MTNYELSRDNIKEIDWATSQIKQGLSSLKGDITNDESKQSVDKQTEQTNVSESDNIFYEIKDNNATLKMDIVKNYLNTIKDKEYSDLKANNPAAWIMAVQIALRSTQIGGDSHDKYGSIQIDGILGSQTMNAVKKFQSEYGLEDDGYPGKNTLNKIYAIITGEVATNAEISSNSSTDTSTNTSQESKEKEPADSEIVSIKDYIKDIKYDLRYATTDNFTGKVIYDSAEAKLRYGTVKKLKKAQEDLMKQGYSIKIWDAYRPQLAQEKLRAIRPDPALVARPEKGSNHTRGNAIDVTLVKADGTEIPMPTEFDSNDKQKIDRNYSDLTPDQAKNAKLIQDAMEKAGFKGYKGEWWHYDDTKTYPMERGN